jgi:hypothetical protein
VVALVLVLVVKSNDCIVIAIVVVVRRWLGSS